MRIAVLALTLVGCAEGPSAWDQRPLAVQEPLPEAWARAVDAIWSAYGQTSAPPAVRLVTAFDCEVAGSGDPGWTDEDGACLAGRYWWWPREVLVTNPRPEPGLLDWMHLAHELRHAALGDVDNRGDCDPAHALPGWEAGGPVELAGLAAVQ